MRLTAVALVVVAMVGASIVLHHVSALPAQGKPAQVQPGLRSELMPTDIPTLELVYVPLASRARITLRNLDHWCVSDDPVFFDSTAQNPTSACGRCAGTIRGFGFTIGGSITRWAEGSLRSFFFGTGSTSTGSFTAQISRDGCQGYAAHAYYVRDEATGVTVSTGFATGECNGTAWGPPLPTVTPGPSPTPYYCPGW
jgi:hypothetical protein